MSRGDLERLSKDQLIELVLSRGRCRSARPTADRVPPMAASALVRQLAVSGQASYPAAPYQPNARQITLETAAIARAAEAAARQGMKSRICLRHRRAGERADPPIHEVTRAGRDSH